MTRRPTIGARFRHALSGVLAGSLCAVVLPLSAACDVSAQPKAAPPSAAPASSASQPGVQGATSSGKAPSTAYPALNPRLSQTGQARLTTRDGRVLNIAVEIASNDEDRARGLMFRRHLDPMAGMIFVFPDEAPRGFWMVNTFIPLDMLFARADGTIVGIVENAEPLTSTSRAVPAPAKFVLEVNGGFCARHGVMAGDKIELFGLYRLE